MKTKSVAPIPNGIYILATNGEYIPTADWTSAMGSIGVALIATESKFVISKEIGTICRWGIDGVDAGTFSSTVKETALTDYDAANNTENMLLNSCAAAIVCDNYTFANGKHGQLPALGQNNLIMNNLAEINSALVLCGGVAYNTATWYWSSTQYNKNGAWHSWIEVNDLVHSNGSKTNDFRARPIYTI